MKKWLCAFLALWLGLCPGVVGLGEAATVTLEYSLLEKLSNQLKNRSGLLGTLTATLTAKEGMESEAITTAMPLVLDLSFIEILPERRYDAALKKGEDVLTTFSLATMNGAAYISSGLLFDGWYTLSGLAKTLQGEAEGEKTDEATENGLQSLLRYSPAPGLTNMLLPALFSLFAQSENSEEMEEAIAPYLTKVDLWIEGYREGAVLGKTTDGISTVSVNYHIPAAAIKAQLKQLLMDVLGDDRLLPKLQETLPQEFVQEMFDPARISDYFWAVDCLPLEESLAISRTINLRGETLALHISLPLHDPEAGAMVLSYDRETGSGKDMPDENAITLETEDVLVTLEYQKYLTMTGVAVYQGRFLQQTLKEQSQEEETEGMKPITADFSLTLQETQGHEPEEGYDTLQYDYAFTLEPSTEKKGKDGMVVALSEEEKAALHPIPALEGRAWVVLKSKPERNQAILLEAEATVEGKDMPEILHLSFAGRTRNPWLPIPVDVENAVDISAMTALERTGLWAQVGIKAGIYFLPFLRFPVELVSPDAASPEVVETETPTDAPVETPVVIPTEAPTQAPPAT